ncbi:hypothetical protein Dimus_007066 [Dionaea muscipula]
MGVQCAYWIDRIPLLIIDYALKSLASRGANSMTSILEPSKPLRPLILVGISSFSLGLAVLVTDPRGHAAAHRPLAASRFASDRRAIAGSGCGWRRRNRGAGYLWFSEYLFLERSWHNFAPGAEATDVANASLDGSDAILLGAETFRGFYQVETKSTVGKICSEAEKVFNLDLYFKRTVKYVGEPMTHLESIASSVVRSALKVKASIIICFTSSGRAARLIAKYRPTMPVLSVVIPRLKTNQLKWSFSGAFEARQSLIVRGFFPMLADPQHPAESTNARNESVLKVALDHGKAAGIIKSHDRVVVCQKVGDASVKIIELED